MTRIFMDTEFIEDGHTIELVSIALVSDAGGTYYAVSSEFDPERASARVHEHALPRLPTPEALPRKRRGQIRDDIIGFVTALPKPWEFWAYFADYDWVVFCQLFGRMVDLPTGFPMFCLDLKQEMERCHIRREDLPKNEHEHDALADAAWVRRALEVIEERVAMP